MEAPSKEQLEELRTEGYTREELADMFDVSLSQVKRWITELKVTKKIVRKGGARHRTKVSNGQPLPEDYGMNVLERAQRTLGDRMTYRKGCGYYLDGRLVSVDQILSAAGVSYKS